VTSAPEPLLRSRQADTAARIARCERAIERLIARGEPVTVAAVARIAGVGEKFPFRHAPLKASIDAAKTQVTDSSRPDLDSALRAERDYWKSEAHRIGVRLSRAVSRLADLEGERVSIERGLVPPRDQADEQRQQLEQLTATITALQTRLEHSAQEIEAVRRLNRDLVRENTRLRHG
jgi:chromosome segregation ATPase